MPQPRRKQRRINPDKASWDKYPVLVYTSDPNRDEEPRTAADWRQWLNDFSDQVENPAPPSTPTAPSTPRSTPPTPATHPASTHPTSDVTRPMPASPRGLHSCATSPGSNLDVADEYDALAADGWELIPTQPAPGYFPPPLRCRPAAKDRS